MTSLGCRLFGPELRAGLVRTPIRTPVRWETAGRALDLIGCRLARSERESDGKVRLMAAGGARWSIHQKADGWAGEDRLSRLSSARAGHPPPCAGRLGGRCGWPSWPPNDWSSGLPVLKSCGGAASASEGCSAARSRAHQTAAAPFHARSRTVR